MTRPVIELPDIPDLADRLVYLRKTFGLSQTELARLAGATQQAVNQAESGKSRQPRYLPQLARELDIPLDWLTMNMRPDPDAHKAGFGEKDHDVLSSFYAMPPKDQSLMLELMKARKKTRKKKN